MGPCSSVDLIERVRKVRPGTTKQGVYAVLRDLAREEVIVRQNKKVSFNIRWLRAMEEFFLTTERQYFDGKFGRENFLNLKEGERITYSFADPVQTDAFWGHALYMLVEVSPVTGKPVYLYNPHEWFLIARRASEREFMAAIGKKRGFFLTTGGNTPLDRSVAKDFDNQQSQYFMRDKPLFKKQNYYVNIIDDVLIEVWIDRKVAEKIEALYQITSIVNDNAKEELTHIVQSKGRSKLTISKNAKKSARLVKMLKNPFYTPNVVL